MAGPKVQRWTVIFAILPAVVTLLAFSPSLSNEFVDWDDMGFIVDNVHIRRMEWPQIRWMFSSFRMGPYQPIPWLTLALDYQLGGLNPAQYHATSLLWHAGMTFGFFAVARRLFYASGPADPGWRTDLAACMATILFAVHPLRVESVVWASERRDVVAGFFLVWSVWAYLRAVTGSRNYLPWLLSSLSLYAMSLASKATGMCLPLVLTFLDIYPFGRIHFSKWWRRGGRHVWLEKVPFWLLSAACAIAAMYGQIQAGTLAPIQTYGLVERVAVASYASIFYVVKTLFPIRLSPLYEIPLDFRPWAAPFVVAGAALLLVTGASWLARRRQPALLLAWTSYLTLLAPVSGLAQAGMQLAADRYTYVPCMSLALLAGCSTLSWYRRGAMARRPHAGWLAAAAAIVILLGTLTWMQTRVWRNTGTLWAHAIRVNPRSSMAHNNAAMALLREQRYIEAYRLLQIALQLRPNNGDAHNNMAIALRRLGRPYEAMEHYRIAEQAKTRPAEVQHNIGLLLAEEPHLERLGFATIEDQWQAALEHFQRSLSLKPDQAKTLNDLGILLKKMGRFEEAARYYEQAIELDIDSVAAQYNLANLLAAMGREAEAIERYDWVLRIQPGHLQTSINLANLQERRGAYGKSVAVLREALARAPANELVQYNLGWLLAAAPDLQVRQGDEAVALAMRLRGRTGADPRILDLLAAALAETGDFQQAQRAARQARDVAAERQMTELVQQIELRLSLYEDERPFRIGSR